MTSHNIDNVAALEVSGEAVEAEFEKYLRQLISPRDFKGDLERLIYQICREFKEESSCEPPKGLRERLYENQPVFTFRGASLSNC
jgi:hypothetical protein